VRDEAAGSHLREAELCIGPRSALKRAIATDTDHGTTEMRLVEKGDAVLEVMGRDWGWRPEVYDLSTLYQLRGVGGTVACAADMPDRKLQEWMIIGFSGHHS
jgi:hypothetical protein